MRRAATITLLAALGALAARSAADRHRRRLDLRVGLGPDGIVGGGGPLALAGADDRAVLLLHGFGDTPQSLAFLAGWLHARGWTVHAPLLPGHGRTLRAFTGSTAAQWVAHARDAYAALRARHPTVAVVGQSMGGALAAVLAAETIDPPDALVLLAPYLEMPPRLRRLADAHPYWSPLLPLVGSRGARSILDTAAQAESLAYDAVSGRLLTELRAVVDRAGRALPAVHAPTLVVQSRRDHRIAPDACRRAVARLGARRRRLVWVDDGGHVLSADRGRERVAHLVAAWLAGATQPVATVVAERGPAGIV